VSSEYLLAKKATQENMLNVKCSLFYEGLQISHESELGLRLGL